MQLNLEKVIPEIWWDFFGRLIPGIVVFYEIKIFASQATHLKFIESFSNIEIIVAAYIIGHFIQPLGSRTDEFFANHYRKVFEKEYDGEQKPASCVLTIPPKSNPSGAPKLLFRDIMNAPKNFLEAYIAAKKKHSEAVSFFSVFWPSLLIMLYFQTGIKPSYITAGIATTILVLYLTHLVDQKQSKDKENESISPVTIVTVIFVILGLFAIFAAVNPYSRDYKISPLLIVILVSAIGGVERSKNTIGKQSSMLRVYRKPNNEAICDDAIVAKPSKE